MWSSIVVLRVTAVQQQANPLLLLTERLSFYCICGGTRHCKGPLLVYFRRQTEVVAASLWRWPNGRQANYFCSIFRLSPKINLKYHLHFLYSAPRQQLPWERTWSVGTLPRLTPSPTRPGNSSSTPTTGFQRGTREVCHSLSVAAKCNFIMNFIWLALLLTSENSFLKLK